MIRARPSRCREGPAAEHHAARPPRAARGGDHGERSLVVRQIVEAGRRVVDGSRLEGARVEQAGRAALAGELQALALGEPWTDRQKGHAERNQCVDGFDCSKLGPREHGDRRRSNA
jgi:hypothetical protein